MLCKKTECCRSHLWNKDPESQSQRQFYKHTDEYCISEVAGLCEILGTSDAVSNISDMCSKLKLLPSSGISVSVDKGGIDSLTHKRPGLKEGL